MIVVSNNEKVIGKFRNREHMIDELSVNKGISLDGLSYHDEHSFDHRVLSRIETNRQLDDFNPNQRGRRVSEDPRQTRAKKKLVAKVQRLQREGYIGKEVSVARLSQSRLTDLILAYEKGELEKAGEEKKVSKPVSKTIAKSEPKIESKPPAKKPSVRGRKKKPIEVTA